MISGETEFGLRESGRIFGIGLSRTGTTSLGKALNILGVRTVHYPYNARLLSELSSGIYRLSVLNKFRGMVDIPAAPFFAQFDEEYPGSRFILTTRDTESWIDSMRRHWPRMQQLYESDPDFQAFTEFICLCVYGCLEFSERRFLFVKGVHEANVRQYFSSQPEKLLEINITEGDGWEVLCPFLGRPIPKQRFPHANKG